MSCEITRVGSDSISKGFLGLRKRGCDGGFRREIARRGVGPVEVLQDEHERPFIGQAVEDAKDTVAEGARLHYRTVVSAFTGGARVIATDVRASNGIIHVVNKVFIPRSPDGLGPPGRGTAPGSGQYRQHAE